MWEIEFGLFPVKFEHLACSSTVIKAREKAYKVVAFAAVAFSLTAVLAVCITMPIVRLLSVSLYSFPTLRSTTSSFIFNSRQNTSWICARLGYLNLLDLSELFLF